jgi:hypothetical protein
MFDIVDPAQEIGEEDMPLRVQCLRNAICGSAFSISHLRVSHGISTPDVRGSAPLLDGLCKCASPFVSTSIEPEIRADQVTIIPTVFSVFALAQQPEFLCATLAPSATVYGADYAEDRRIAIRLVTPTPRELFDTILAVRDEFNLRPGSFLFMDVESLSAPLDSIGDFEVVTPKVRCAVAVPAWSDVPDEPFTLIETNMSLAARFRFEMASLKTCKAESMRASCVALVSEYTANGENVVDPFLREAEESVDADVYRRTVSYAVARGSDAYVVRPNTPFVKYLSLLPVDGLPGDPRHSTVIIRPLESISAAQMSLAAAPNT